MRGLKLTFRDVALAFVLLLGASFSPGAAQMQAAPNGRYVNLHEAADYFNLRPVWRTEGEELQLTGGFARLEFTSDSRSIQINGMRVFLGEPVLLHDDQLFINEVDFNTTLKPVLKPQSQMPAGVVETVALDPGHGGRDAGTRSQELNLREKDLTLRVSRRLKETLEERGYRVILTRTSDSYVPLEKRSAIADQAGADLFLSIHFNAVGNPAIEGTETYVLTPQTHRSTGQKDAAASDSARNAGNENDHWNALLGFLVQRQLLRDLETFDRGLKRARFRVLREVECPAVLVEAGYLSNPREAARLGGAEYQEKFVHSLAAAVDRYQHAIENISASAR